MKPITHLHRPASGRFVTSVIIGAGQAGLAMSHCLSEADIDHVLLERGEVANSWHKERWDSLRLLSPNWLSRLPGKCYDGVDPNGFMTVPELINYLTDYSRSVTAPIFTGVTVTEVSRTQSGYRVQTSEGEWQCKTVVIASGACNISMIPGVAEAMPASIDSLTPMQYRNPDQLRDGGVLVVGASASGLQLASEIQNSGRQVTVAVGEQVRMPRRYRGHDIMWWMDQSGLFDLNYKEVDDIGRARRTPSSQLVGGDRGKDLDINSLQQEGIDFVGRLAFVHNNKAQFSGSLANVCKMADLKMRRLLKHIDNYAKEQRIVDIPEAVHPEDTRLSDSPRLEMNLISGEIKTVIWATGYRPDYSWLKVPVLDAKGLLKHDGGVVGSPGLYALGLPFLRRRKSQFIDGVGDDARDLCAHMKNYLDESWYSTKVSVA